MDNPKPFLVKIVTSLSISCLSSAKKKRQEYIGTWLPERLAGGRKVACFLITVMQNVMRLSDNPASRLLVVGGMPCVITCSAGKPVNLSVMETDGAQVLNIHSYGNPEKIESSLAFVQK